MALRIDGQSTNQSLIGLQDATKRLSDAGNKLASGRRITDSGVDPAGLSMAKRLAAERAGLETVQRGIQDGVSLIQTAENGLAAIGDQVGRIRELATQAANGTLSDADRTAIQDEVDELLSEIDRTAQQTEFNGRRLLNGESGAGSGVAVPTSAGGGGTSVEIEDSGAAALGLGGLDVRTTAGAAAALDATEAAASSVSERRSALGAQQNSLASAISEVQVASENTEAARSRIEDADVARQVAAQTAARIQQEFSIAVQAQLNQNQGSVLRLLQP